MVDSGDIVTSVEENGLELTERSKEIESAESKNEKYSQSAMTRDVCFVSVGFLCLFTSFQSLSNLQSSINPGVGTASQSVLYITMVVSALFIPTWLLNKIGVKNSMALSTLGYTVFGAAQAYPNYYTLVPASFILGVGAAPLWTAKCTYLGYLGTKYSEVSGEDSQVVITRFFGIFFMFFQMSQVIGNTISSLVLGTNSEIMNSSDPRLQQCGLNYCPIPLSPSTGDVIAVNSSSLSAEDPISSAERYTLTAVFLFFSIISPIVIIVFVSPLSKYGGNERIGSSTGRTNFQQILATFSHLKNPYQILIVPLTIYSGVQAAFLFADYTAAYVSCGLGIHMVGFTMITFGITNAICSYFCSSIVKRVGRIPTFVVASAINAALIVVLYLWRPNPDQIFVFFLIPAIWGVANAVWGTVLKSLYVVLFPTETEAAFSNQTLWTSLGFIIAYITSTLVCIPVKIYILISFLISGTLGYATIEILEFRKKK